MCGSASAIFLQNMMQILSFLQISILHIVTQKPKRIKELTFHCHNPQELKTVDTPISNNPTQKDIKTMFAFLIKDPK
jgi:hypothetical protein